MLSATIRRRGVHTALALLFVLAACQKSGEKGSASSSSVERVEGRAKRAPLTDDEVAQVGTLTRALLEGTPADTAGFSGTLTAESSKPSALASVELRATGKLVHRGYAVGKSAVAALSSAVKAGLDKAGARASSVDAVVVNLGYNFRKVEGRKNRGLTNTRSKGVRGLELVYGDKMEVIPPTQMIEDNASFGGYAQRFAKRAGTDVGDVQSFGGYRVFDVDQVHVRRSGEPVATRMYRGNTLVTMESLTKDRVQALTESLAHWMFANLMEDGRMTYLYDPRSESEPRGNNMIRQWLGTIAMTRWAKRVNDQALLDKAEKNIRYNLEHYYKENGELGYIVWEGTSKLGAIALAALALVEHPAREKFADYEKKLLNTTYELFNNETGRFEPFYIPRSQDGKNLHNFYPGETLLLWSFLYEKNQDPKLLEKLMKGFHHYRDWHVDESNRKPAFVPWQAQAAYNVWKQTKDPFLKDFVFEISDWLISEMQDGEWERAKRDGYPDHMGRFFSAKRPKFFGPPHSASTGVYLEGLIDAHELAKAVGDAARQERYRQSIMRGIRSTAQLAFKDDVDMYYSSNRDRLLGGVRSRSDRNTIRVDNVQHNMMGLMKILSGFAPEDYRP